MAEHIAFCTRTIESLKQKCVEFRNFKYPKVVMPEFEEDCIEISEVKKRLEILIRTKACVLKMLECANKDEDAITEAGYAVSMAIGDTKKLLSDDEAKITPKEKEEIKRLQRYSPKPTTIGSVG